MDSDARLALLIHTADRDEEIRGIFEEFAGRPIEHLRRELMARGIATPHGLAQWNSETVVRTRWRMKHRYGWKVGPTRLDRKRELVRQARQDREELEQARWRAT